MNWIDHVKKYSLENDMSFKDAMKDEECKKSYKMKKGGLIGPAIRRDYKPQIRDFLKKYGDRRITSITLQRVPIESMLKGVLDFLTMGKYSETTKKLGYDKVFHLSMIITLEGLNKYVVVEKNEVINISFNIPPMKKGGARMIVPFRKQLTLNQMLDNANKNMGNRFFLYDAFNKNGGGNCQDFILSLLKYSDILTPQAQNFILQDAKEILKGLPEYTPYITRGLTDLGAQFDRVIYGKGA
jgi:hypothetical protein